MPDSRDALIEGFGRFHNKYYNASGLMKKLVREGARPDFFVINCIDPRNGAEHVFDCEPGMLFEDSQMAAIVPPYEAGKNRELTAALTYAIDVLQIKHLIIMGHSHCAGCEALVSGAAEENGCQIGSWIGVAQEALQIAKLKAGNAGREALLRETEKQIVIHSLANILGYRAVRKAFLEGRLTLNGWYFEMERGALHEYDPSIAGFRQIAGPRVIPAPVPAQSCSKSRCGC